MYGTQAIGILATLLISLALGYFVCAQAKGQNILLKIVGYILGVVIMIGSILLSISTIKVMAVKKDPQKILEQLLKSGSLSGNRPMPAMQKRLPSEIPVQ